MIIAKEAEKKLFEQLNDDVVHNPLVRCLYVRLSTLDIDFKEWFPRFAYEFSKYFDDKNLSVYVCHDRDIFITSRVVTQTKFDQFTAYLTQKLQPALPTELATFFEVGIDWGRLKTLCQRKIDAFSEKKKIKNIVKKDIIASVTTDQTFGALDVNLISSLSMRRDMRNDTDIMVVEDDIFSQKLIQNALSHYDVSFIEDGQGAVMNYVAKAPDVLFLDIGLPDIDGMTVLKKIFDIDPDAYVIMFSGNGSKENIMNALEIGAKGFVGKPFTKDKLFAYIEKSPHIIAKKG